MKTTAARAFVMVAAALLVLGCGGDDDSAELDDDVTTPSALVDQDADDQDADGDEGTGENDEYGDANEDDAAELSEVCPLLDGVDTAELLGEAPGEPEERTETCTVEAASSESRGGVSLVVSTMAAAANYDNRVELFGIDSEPSGFGDRAFHSGPYLIVLDGDTLVQLQVVRDASLGPGVDDALLESAMTTVLSNLG